MTLKGQVRSLELIPDILEYIAWFISKMVVKHLYNFLHAFLFVGENVLHIYMYSLICCDVVGSKGGCK